MLTAPPPALDRLRDSATIASVLAARTQRAGEFVVLCAIDRRDDQPSRFAVVASRRVGTAVARNRAKRVLREAARGVAFRPGLDLVLIARRDAAAALSSVVTQELGKLASALDLTAAR